VITAGSAAVREWFADDQHVIAVPADDPTALADALVRLRDDSTLLESVAHAGRDRVIAVGSPAQIAGQWLAALQS
jgi:glycosyltransferase involved in cell wall biosynthesis